jgi:hypothetical protein
MKKVFLFIAILSVSLFSQELHKIYTTNGNVVVGILMPTSNDSIVTIKLSNGLVFNFDKKDVIKSEIIQISKTGSIGFGFGATYGIIGANLELSLIKNFYLSGGVGSTIIAGLGYSIGAKYYLKNVGKTWRPRLLISYGTVGAVAEERLENGVTVEKHEDTFDGLILGIGQQWMFGDRRNIGLDFDALFVIQHEKINTEIFEDSPDPVFGLSIGFRLGF